MSNQSQKVRQQKNNVAARKKKARAKAIANHGVATAPWRTPHHLSLKYYHQRMHESIIRSTPTKQELEAKERLLCRLFNEPYRLT